MHVKRSGRQAPLVRCGVSMRSWLRRLRRAACDAWRVAALNARRRLIKAGIHNRQFVTLIAGWRKHRMRSGITTSRIINVNS